MLTAKKGGIFFIKRFRKKLFNKNVVLYNGKKFYEDNVRLIKYKFLAQVFYMAKS